MTLEEFKIKSKQKLFHWTKSLFNKLFRVSVHGSWQAASKSVIIANRTSAIDVLLLSLFIPEKLTIALPPHMLRKLWVKAFAAFVEVIPVDPSSAQAARLLIKAIRKGKRCIIFPQGVEGNMQSSQRIFDGPGLVIQKAGAEVIPVRISGPEQSIFSVNKAQNRIRWFPQFSLHLMPALAFTQKAHQPVNREAVSLRLFRLISEMHFDNLNHQQPLFKGLLDGAYMGHKHGATIEDSNRNPLSYGQFVMRTFILGRQFKKQTKPKEYVGLMMPTTVAGMICFFAMQAYRRIPAMLNFSMGFYHLYSACQTAGIKTIYTSRQFVATAKLESLVDELVKAGLTVHYLEDFKDKITLLHKLSGMVKALFPRLTYKITGQGIVSSDTAVVLFTSGSEGMPKGVLLSHENILANCMQMVARVDFSSKDLFFNSLPIFHCFGLTAGAVLPLVTGNRCFFYPSPLHYKIIPGLVYQTGATIMFATDTFLTGYARSAGAHDFSSVRYIFAGAEKVKPETIRHWAETFGARIYEGYGATEAAPVISLNCPMAMKAGSVGMMLPRMSYRLESVDGIHDGGRLYIRGPNVMQGYMRADNPGVIEPPVLGWHDTGDIVTVDESGFITIAGRAKRFAKLGGEMVSLTAVESIASSLWPEQLHAAASMPCARKGEQIVLFTEVPEAQRSEFIQYVKQHGFSELLIPQKIQANTKIPVLPSGKIDYMTIRDELLPKMALDTVVS